MRTPLIIALFVTACGARTPLRITEDSGSPVDAVRVDALDVTDISDISDISDVTDTPDVSDALDVSDAPDALVEPDVPDGAVCVSGTFSLRSRPAEILFVVDRSGSFAPSWNYVSGAFAAALPAIDGALSTGLLLFPERGCEVSPTLHVELGLSNSARIASTLEAVRPSGRTPTRVAITTASQTLRARAGERSGFIMLVTDGVPTCPLGGLDGDRDLTGTVSAVAASAAAGVPVFVIGVGDTSGEMGTSLDQLAIAGGRPITSADGRRYYAVDDVSSGLLTALRTVQSTVTRCELAITTPAEGASVRVDFDGVPIEEDPTGREGWWWSDARRMAITVHGGWCSRLVRESGELRATVSCADR